MPTIETELLERSHELGVIEETLDAALDGNGALLVIEGEAGAGKTSLLDAAARRGGERGVRVLRARGGEFERDFPYGIVRQLFEPILREEGGRDRLTGSAGLATAVFEGGGGGASESDRFGVMQGIYWLIADLAEEEPIALLVDDLQWADLASLHSLLYVVRRLEGVPAAIFASVRTGEGGPSEDLVGQLRGDPSARTVAPAPLSREAVAELIGDRMGEVPSSLFSAACHAAGGGNPFLSVELARAASSRQMAPTDANAGRLDEIGAGGAGRSILDRLARLGGPASEVARAVAILEPNARLEHVEALVDLDPDAVAAAASQLISAQLLEDAIPLRFVHPLVRHAVHADMAEPTRALLHASAANRLREAGEAVDTVASHLLLAPPAGDPTVVAALLGAAEGAMARGAPASAVEYLRRALREPPDEAEREEISRGLGDALLRADDAEGIEVLASILDRSTDPDERAEIAAWMIVALAGRGRVEEAHDLYLGALEELGKHEGHTGVLIKGFALMLPMVGLEEIPAGAVIAADDAGFDNRTIAGRVLLEGSALLTAYGLGTIERARELAELSILDRRTAITDAEAGYPRHRTVLTLTLADRQDLVEDAAEEMTQASRRRGSINGVAYGHAIRSLCLALDGELQEAVASAELAVELAGQTDQLANLENWTSMLAMILIHRGELGRVAELLSAPPLAGDLGGGIPAANLLIRRGELHLASGRATEARDAFLAAGDRVAWLPRANPEVLPWRIGLAEAEMTLGNEEGAREIAEEGVERAVEAGGRRGIGIALRVRGKVLGDLEVLGEAVETLAGTRARLQHAIALVELGAALRRANRRSEAREPLREGLELAHRSGAAPLEDRARTELEATGARPRSAVRSGVDALTPSELRAARMAADGMTNREIAQALFVTAKTVETHLRHAYQKLGIEGRGGLAEALAPRA